MESLKIAVQSLKTLLNELESNKFKKDDFQNILESFEKKKSALISDIESLESQRKSILELVTKEKASAYELADKKVRDAEQMLANAKTEAGRANLSMRRAEEKEAYLQGREKEVEAMKAKCDELQATLTEKLRKVTELTSALK